MQDMCKYSNQQATPSIIMAGPCRCKSAITRDYARMLSAEEAVEKWTESLVKQLQALPQQPAVKKAVKKSAGQKKTWGLEITKKLGLENLTSPITDTAVSVANGATAHPRSTEPHGLGIAITKATDIKALAAAARSQKQAVASSTGGDAGPAEATDTFRAVQQSQQAVPQDESIAVITTEPSTQPTALDLLRLSALDAIKRAKSKTETPKGAMSQTEPQSGAVVAGNLEDDCKTDARSSMLGEVTANASHRHAENAELPGPTAKQPLSAVGTLGTSFSADRVPRAVAPSASGFGKAESVKLPTAAMRIPKEWLTRMQKK